ncbi:MAG: BatD family protein, partial [Phycisphaerales bacterium]|nr:BatD family protein [Phycisphaerales bacterium]
MKYLFTLLFTFSLFSSVSFAQEVFVDMPQNQGYIGIPLKLVVVYKDVKTDREPTIPEIDGFTISRKPGTETSSQTTFINGKVTSTSTIKFTYYLTPQRVGSLDIPAITFIADGKAFQTVPKTIEIVETPTSGALKVQVKGTNSNVYLGQPIDMTLQIFVEQFTDKNLGVTLDARDMFSLFSNNSSFGLFTQALQDGRAQVQTIQGTSIEGVPTTFYVYTVQATTWPETTGTLHFDPISIIANYPISLSRQRSTGFFGGSSLTVDQAELISAQAEMPTIEVLTPPENDRPEWHSGAVGNFDFRVVAEPTNVNVGEPITLTMRVTDLSSGPVNLDYLSAPALDRVTALTSKFKVPDKPLGGTIQGRTKTFTETIRPRSGGITEIPPLPLSSFDPVTETYTTVWTNPIPITVETVATVSANDLVGGQVQSTTMEPQQITEVDGGILANYTGIELLQSQTTEVTPALVATITFPPLVFSALGCFILVRRRAQSETSILKSSKKAAIQTILSLSNAKSKEQVQQIAKSLRTLEK